MKIGDRVIVYSARPEEEYPVVGEVTYCNPGGIGVVGNRVVHAGVEPGGKRLFRTVRREPLIEYCFSQVGFSVIEVLEDFAVQEATE